MPTNGTSTRKGWPESSFLASQCCRNCLSGSWSVFAVSVIGVRALRRHRASSRSGLAAERQQVAGHGVLLARPALHLMPRPSAAVVARTPTLPSHSTMPDPTYLTASTPTITPTIGRGCKLLYTLLLLLGACALPPCATSPAPRGWGNKHAADVSPEQHRLHHELAAQPYMEVSMHPVSVQYFAQKLNEADSYHDILRIFYGDILTDDVIDGMLSSQTEVKHYGTSMGRPRIGGLSDTMSFSMQSPRLDGIIASPFMLDSPPSGGSPMAAGSQEYADGVDPLADPHRQRHRDRRRNRDPNTNRNRRKDGPAVDAARVGTLTAREELMLATEHAKAMQTQTVCKDPVPVVVRIRDISTAANKEYFPPCTIVHHCRADAGCCNETSACAPKQNVTISRAFFALEYQKRGDLVEAKGQFVESFTFINHTECECKPIQQLPKCLQCPHPFYQRRENHTECTCDCFDRDQTCIRIKKGRRPLEEAELRCIKEGRCHKPKCKKGEFDEGSIKTGYCPRHRSNRRRTGSSSSRDTHRRKGRWR